MNSLFLCFNWHKTFPCRILLRHFSHCVLVTFKYLMPFNFPPLWEALTAKISWNWLPSDVEYEAIAESNHQIKLCWPSQSLDIEAWGHLFWFWNFVNLLSGILYHIRAFTSVEIRMNYLRVKICGGDLWILQIEFLGNKLQISLRASNPIPVEMRKCSF